MYRTAVTICTAQRSLYVPHSGHYMYRTVITICTASLTFTNSTSCPHTVFMCFVWIWEQTTIISLYNINWSVLITEIGCVYCAVRTGSLYAILIIFLNDIWRVLDNIQTMFDRVRFEEWWGEIWHHSLFRNDNWMADRKGKGDLGITLTECELWWQCHFRYRVAKSL
jgi:hypothetical protein